MLTKLNQPIRHLLPGFAIAFTIGLAASFLSEHYTAPAMLFALLLGMSMSFLYEEPRSAPGIDFSARTVLRIGVALLGFRIVMQDLFGLGWETLALVVGGVSTTICFGVLLARTIGLPKRFGLLTGGAVSICGASAALAIAAILPRSADRERDTVFVVVGVTTLSTLAMIVYPILTAGFGLDDTDAGIFIGATIHDVAQVVGAGYSISGTAGDVATLTKLMRVAMLLPVVVICSAIFHASREAGELRPPLLPGFLVAFIICIAINSLFSIPAVILESANSLSRHFLVASIAAIGLKTNLRNMLKIGPRAVILLAVETLWLAAFTLSGMALFH